MTLQATPFTIPVVLAATGFAAFAGYLLSQRAHRQHRGSQIAIALVGALSVWLFAYACQLSVTTLEGKLFFQYVKYVGPASVPLLWFAYVLSYTGYWHAVSRRAWAVLAVPPLAFYGLAFGYPETTLIWTNVDIHYAGTRAVFVNEYGPLFYAYQGYVYTLFVASLWLLVRNLRRSSGVYRRQTLGLVAGSLLPGILGVVHVADVSPFPTLDLPALALVGTAAAVAYSVARNDLFTLPPVAWETAVEQLEDPVFVLNDQNRVVAANAAAAVFANAPVGETATAVLGSVLEDPVWESVGDHETHGSQGGDRRAFEVSVSPVERNGSRLGRVVVVRDVTERRDREERLEEFASVVSHDLRNPLNVAVGHLELGRETGDDAHFEETEDALDRMDDIIDDLLTLARQGDAPLDREAVSLETAARTAWSAVETPAVTLDLAGDRTLQADRTALLRLLENLFRNSVEHAGAEVTVTVGSTATGFYVADDGPGIPPDEHPAVFERGYTTSEEGTGFGLAVVQEVAEAHGWTVSLGESEAGGARFQFDLE